MPEEMRFGIVLGPEDQRALNAIRRDMIKRMGFSAKITNVAVIRRALRDAAKQLNGKKDQ